jgi:hypothetical protein
MKQTLDVVQLEMVSGLTEGTRRTTLRLESECRQLVISVIVPRDQVYALEVPSLMLLCFHKSKRKSMVETLSSLSQELENQCTHQLRKQPQTLKESLEYSQPELCFG